MIDIWCDNEASAAWSNCTLPCSINNTCTTTLAPETTEEFVYPEPPYSAVGTTLLAVIAGITSLATTVGNILVVLAFILEKHLRQPANYLIASLAVTDVLIGMFSMPFYTLYLLKSYWPLSQLLCDLWLSLDYTVCLVSQYTVFLITLDRFCSVKVPAKYRNWRTKTKIKVFISATWLVPALIFFTSILGWHRFTGSAPVNDRQCYAQFQTNPLFTAILVISYYWVTLIVMVGLYIGIYRVALSLHMKARAKRRKMKAMNEAGANSEALEPLNNGISSKGVRLNTNPKARRNEKSSSESSHQQEYSDVSNESESCDDSIRQTPRNINGELTPGTNTSSNTDQTTLHTPHMLESPLWKPRSSIPEGGINWSAFPEISEQSGENMSEICEDNHTTPVKHNHENAIDVITRDPPDAAAPAANSMPGDDTTRGIGAQLQRVVSRISNIRVRIRDRAAESSPKTKSKSENRARKALRTITFILGAFVLCWTPYHVVVLIIPVCQSCVNKKFYEFTYWLCYMNSPLNPFCYALSNQQFKQAFLKILKGEHFRARSSNTNCFKK